MTTQFRTTTSRIRVTFYNVGSEHGFLRSQGSSFSVSGRDERSGEPTLVSATFMKMMDEAAGTFELVIKAPDSFDFTHAVLDDDWVDFELDIFGVLWPIAQCSVDSVREDMTVSATGSAVRTYTVTGRDHGKIFAVTPIWFDRYNIDGITSIASTRIMSYLNAFGDLSPSQAVRSALLGTLTELTGSDGPTALALGQGATGLTFGAGGAVWRLPSSMPVPGQVKPTGRPPVFADAVAYFDRDFDPQRDPVRRAPVQPGTFLDNRWGSDLWSFAEYYADLPLCELYTDLLASSPVVAAQSDVRSDNVNVDYAPTSAPIPRGTAFMGVIFRDKPHPTSVNTRGGAPVNIRKAGRIEDSPWFSPSFPTVYMSAAEIRQSALTRSGTERRNAFYAYPTNRPNANISVDLAKPLWIPRSIREHGLRPSSLNTIYGSDLASSLDGILFMSAAYRQRFADYHVIDHLFMHGELTFARPHPELRVGMKLVVNAGAANERQFYVIGVRHTWSSLDEGVRTSAIVSRGFDGSDSDLTAVLNAIILGQTSSGPGQSATPPPPQLTTLQNISAGQTLLNSNPLQNLVAGATLNSTPTFVASAVTSNDEQLVLPTTRTRQVQAARRNQNGAAGSGRAADFFNIDPTLVFPPYTAKLQSLIQDGIDYLAAHSSTAWQFRSDWADPKSDEGAAMHFIIDHESAGGVVGIPNYKIVGGAPKYYDASYWPEMFQRIENGDRFGGNSGACGLGQLQPGNMKHYVPQALRSGTGPDDNGLGFGSPLAEIVGMLAYVGDRYKKPTKAKAFGAIDRATGAFDGAWHGY